MAPACSSEISAINDDLTANPTLDDLMARFLIKHYDAEAVVFDATSGDTHYLSPLASTLLTTSQAQSVMTYQDISTALALSLNVEPDGDFMQQADEAFRSLQRIGLLAQA